MAYEAHQKTVADVKCPFTLKSFCQLVDAWELGGISAIKAYHPDGKKFFWQLVSNAILTGADYAELIVFVPYRSELPAIRAIAQHDDFTWVSYMLDNELPWLPDGGYYKNLNCFRFPVVPGRQRCPDQKGAGKQEAPGGSCGSRNNLT